ncbi:hypothetical protein PMI09_00658 [Rhizobium sp. CF122]|uniref:helix-turn-helix domain-containing protein n=1 Tax=Rhizobium sp. CF122 TaxID=1144312 RepID=UPI000271A014|nr:helix-turn-helix domain-containing protein [Rhizobium sp. CF122]EJL57953.1 hypothetical protein PMI09_00658 [Rhizobium sp. CF122]
MSHEATMWAVKVRGISCAEARVLWHLADCHNPIFGCYPKQDYLADACEIDERSVRRCLGGLREKGLVNWIEQREGKNRKANRYSLGFEQGFQAFSPVENAENEADNLSGSHDGSTGQEVQLQPDKFDTLNRTPESSIEPVREPVIEPVREREARERDFSGSDSSNIAGVVNADLVKRVQKFCTGQGYREGEWPKWAKSTIGHIAKQFAQLSIEERDAACEWRDAFLAKCKRDRISQPMPVANYFRDKVWTMLDEADKAVVRPVAGGAPAISGGKIVVPVFGPAFGAARAWSLVSGPVNFELPDDLRERVRATYEVHARRGASAAVSYLQKLGLSERDGEIVFPLNFEAQERVRRTTSEGYPEANRLHDAAKDRAHVTVWPVFEHLKELCEAVPVGSAMWDRWRVYHDERGWPFGPAPHHQRVVFFPKGGPDGLNEFERAAREIMDQERDNDHAA